jgi:hypothetical protein
LNIVDVVQFLQVDRVIQRYSLGSRIVGTDLDYQFVFSMGIGNDDSGERQQGAQTQG